MSNLDLSPIKQASFAVEPSLDGAALTARFSGNADMRAIQDIETFLPKLHAEAQRLGSTEVVVNFNELEFMNSSCFKSFVGWISTVQEQPGEKQYRIRFVSNPKMYWQKRSLHALRCFAMDLITIDA